MPDVMITAVIVIVFIQYMCMSKLRDSVTENSGIFINNLFETHEDNSSIKKIREADRKQCICQKQGFS